MIQSTHSIYKERVLTDGGIFELNSCALRAMNDIREFITLSSNITRNITLNSNI